jgi:hypothetical protein
MIWKINFISGGQSGTDRASLDFAIAKHLSHGGWCAKGRLAEDGALDAKYQLRETPLEGTMQRSEWNVRDAEAVVVFTMGSNPMSDSIDAMKFAKMQKKPVLHLHHGVSGVPEKLVGFLNKHGVRRVNVVGSRETEEQGIYEWVAKMLGKTYDLVMSTEPPPMNIGGKIRSPGSR